MELWQIKHSPGWSLHSVANPVGTSVDHGSWNPLWCWMFSFSNARFFNAHISQMILPAFSCRCFNLKQFQQPVLVGAVEAMKGWVFPAKMEPLVIGGTMNVLSASFAPITGVATSATACHLPMLCHFPYWSLSTEIMNHVFWCLQVPL